MKGVDQGCDGFYLESINHQSGNREEDQNDKKQESQRASNAGRDGLIRQPDPTAKGRWYGTANGSSGREKLSIKDRIDHLGDLDGQDRFS